MQAPLPGDAMRDGAGKTAMQSGQAIRPGDAMPVIRRRRDAAGDTAMRCDAGAGAYAMQVPVPGDPVPVPAPVPVPVSVPERRLFQTIVSNECFKRASDSKRVIQAYVSIARFKRTFQAYVLSG